MHVVVGVHVLTIVLVLVRVKCHFPHNVVALFTISEGTTGFLRGVGFHVNCVLC